MGRDGGTALAGWRILVVEDEYFVAQELVALLADAGAEVIGPLPTLEQARAALDADTAAPIDAAVLDVNLGGEMVWPLVDALASRGVPVLLSTGYSELAIPAPYADLPRCEKPVDRGDLIALLRR